MPDPRPPSRVADVPRLALTKREAAESLGISVEHFERHVMHELRVIRRGRRWLVPVTELQKWLEEAAARTIDP